jgi:multidrug resistance efflux pump
MSRKYLLPLMALGLLIFAVVHVVTAQQEKPKLEPPREPARASYAHSVAGAGIVEAQTENIAIGSALPGVVMEVYVPVEKVGQRVKAGEPLFRVDDRALKAQLRVQEANLAAAEAQLAKLDAQPRPEELPPSEAKVKVAQANVNQQEDLATRARRLLTSRAMADEDVTQRQLGLETARQQLAQAKADHALLNAGAWKPDKDIAYASILQARAQIEQTRTELDRSIVRAPVDGDVLQVNVRAGEYVGTPPNQALIVLGNVHQLHVRVDIDEHDIPRFRPGSSAQAMVRGNPQVAFGLQFVRVEPFVIPKKSLTGDSTERVDTRVLQVIYRLEKSDQPVYVGQQLDVFIQSTVPGVQR